ncbi:MAG: regulatory protein RecX [Nitrospinales bacterium]
MPLKDEYAQAKSNAIKYVAYRDRSKKEVANHLAKKEFSEDIVEKTLNELATLGYIDDDRFSVNWGSLRANNKKFGKNRVLKELLEKGVDLQVAEQAVEKIYLNIDENLFAIALAKNKLASMQGRDPRKNIHATAQYLDRQGFSRDVIEQTLDRLIPQ